MSNEFYFEIGGGDNVRLDKKIKFVCLWILGIEVLIMCDVILFGGFICLIVIIIGFFWIFLMSNWVCFEICFVVYILLKNSWFLIIGIFNFFLIFGMILLGFVLLFK